MNNKIDKKEELTETIFKLVEDVVNIEENVKEIKKETHFIEETIKQDIKLIYEKIEKPTQENIEHTENLNENHNILLLSQKITEMENEINSLKDSSLTNEIKIIFKQEIKRWQNIFIGMVSVFCLLSIGLFIFIEKISIGISIAYIGFCIVFCIAIYLTNTNFSNLHHKNKSK